jgi:hypothetical protein
LINRGEGVLQPLEDGRRLGLRIITPDNRAGYLDGQQARELLMPAGTPAEFSLVSHPLVVMKEAVLDFARRHELPPPVMVGRGDNRAERADRCCATERRERENDIR